MATIFIPGIKASELVDTYPMDPHLTWSTEDMVVGNVFESALDIQLTGGRYDRGIERMLRPGGVIQIAYGKLVSQLRRDVEPQVYVFPYDWRKSIESAAERLVEFIDHVKGKMAAHSLSPVVNFVTHSMGGLVLRSALTLLKPDPFAGLGRILFVAPPFRGSCDIPKVLIAGEKNGWLSDEEDFRKLARGFPSVYQLIPSFERAAVAQETGEALDLFEMKSWQGNVVEKERLSETFLADAEAHRKGEDAAHGGESPAPLLPDEELRDHADHVAVVQSVGHETVRTIPVETENENNRNWYHFDEARTDVLGDERVHLLSSAVEGLTLGAFRGLTSHGTVCRERIVIRAAVDWISGNRLIKMKPREPRHVIDRSRTYFDSWDGDPASFDRHIVD